MFKRIQKITANWTAEWASNSQADGWRVSLKTIKYRNEGSFFHKLPFSPSKRLKEQCSTFLRRLVYKFHLWTSLIKTTSLSVEGDSKWLSWSASSLSVGSCVVVVVVVGVGRESAPSSSAYLFEKKKTVNKFYIIGRACLEG